MTSETTQTTQAAQVIENVGDLITGKQAVLFDFDGPICRLFHGHPANGIRRRLVAWIDQEAGSEFLPRGWEERDPHSILRAVHDRHPDSEVLVSLNEQMAHE